jgi:hypothetical protein
MSNSIQISTQNSFMFCKSVWNNLSNRKYFLWGIVLSFVSFVIFKYLYPYPDFFSDSYSYLYAAANHMDVNVWPIGYSKFLEFIHICTSSDTALTAVQYFLIQIAELYLYFTIIYFFTTSMWTRRLLFLFLFVNPLTLYLANTINSDALFAALSLTWISQLIWAVQKPRAFSVIVQAILLVLSFTVRNNAYYYPLITLLGISLSKQSLLSKFIGLGFSFLLLIAFIVYTEQAAKKLTGISQYSLFTGWQLANNALYIYGQIKVDSTDFRTPESKELNLISKRFYSHIKNRTNFQGYLAAYTGNFFIRQPESPLKQYRARHYYTKDELANIIVWGKVSAIYKPFGQTIILHHPIAYARYFMLPNLWNYLVPPLSHLAIYNYGDDTIDPIAQNWFRFPSQTIHVFSHKLQGNILFIYQAFFLLINLFYLWYIIKFTIHYRKFKQTTSDVPLHIIGLTFFLLNLGFNLVATVNILRYQFFPMIAILFLGLLMADTWQIKILGTKQKDLVALNKALQALPI